MKVLSLFSGIGGLDAGFERAGHALELGMEIDPLAQAFCRAQFPGAEVPVNGDVSTFTSAHLRRRFRTTADDLLMLAGAPCQPFSRAGSWVNGSTPGLNDSRARSLECLVGAMDAVRPALLVFENVPAFASSSGGGIDYLMDRLSKVQKRKSPLYEVSYAVLRAQDFGVPQCRNRLFLVASRIGRFDFEPLLKRERIARSAWDALEHIAAPEDLSSLKLRGKWAPLLATIPPGENYLWHTPRGGGKPIFGWRTRFWNFLLKLNPRLPSWTLTANPGSAAGPFHWDNRRLSLEELAALQTLPRKLDFSKVKYTDGVRLIGNAVPTMLAETLAREINVQLLGEQHVEVEQRSRAGSAPFLPSLARVPTRFVPKRAPADHPGEGLGPLWQVS